MKIIFDQEVKVSLRKTDGCVSAGDTDSDPYGSKNYTAGLPGMRSIPKYV